MSAVPGHSALGNDSAMRLGRWLTSEPAPESREQSPIARSSLGTLARLGDPAAWSGSRSPAAAVNWSSLPHTLLRFLELDAGARPLRGATLRCQVIMWRHLLTSSAIAASVRAKPANRAARQVRGHPVRPPRIVRCHRQIVSGAKLRRTGVHHSSPPGEPCAERLGARLAVRSPKTDDDEPSRTRQVPPSMTPGRSGRNRRAQPRAT